MKNLKSILLFLLATISVHASASQYAILKMKVWGSYKLIYVDKPKNLAQWQYDSENDTYYRGKRAGLPVHVYFVNRVVSSQFVKIRPGFFGGLEMVTTKKPEVVKKWQHDSKTDEYYRAKNVWGFHCGVDIINKIKA